MSFDGYKLVIGPGDTVILHIGFANMLTLVVKPGETYQTRYGALRHADLLGVRYGSKIQCSKGWLYVLHPTPELWTVNLPHRTQILYTPDISVVTYQLDLKPGSVVVESGTGSASLSHALIRTIKPSGHLHTFEFHEERSKKAQEEFSLHEVSRFVTVHHRDVCEQGFNLTNVADAVFLDLPRPWLAIESAKQALKKNGGRLCSFSPCIEQVQRTSETLKQHGFHDLMTVECLQKSFDVKTINLNIPDLGYLSEAGETDTALEEENGEPGEAKKPKVSEEGQAMGDNSAAASGEAGLEVLDESTEQCVDEAEESFESDTPKGKKKRNRRISKPPEYFLNLIGKKDEKNFSFKSAVSPQQMAGHTGYLTFATLYPVD